MGDSGNTVQAIQIKLKQEGYYTGKLDGDFGPKTLAAVIAYQKDNGLKPDGIVGNKTLSAMYGTTAQPTGSNVNGYFVPNAPKQSNLPAGSNVNGYFVPNTPATNKNTNSVNSNNSKQQGITPKNVIIQTSKSTIEGVTDAVVGNKISKLPDIKKSITEMPELGVAAKVESSSLSFGTKALKGVTKAAGPAAAISYGYDVYQDVQKYDGVEDTTKAITVTTATTAVTIAGGCALTGVGAPVAVVILGGVLISVAANYAGDYIKKSWIGY